MAFGTIFEAREIGFASPQLAQDYLDMWGGATKYLEQNQTAGAAVIVLYGLFPPDDQTPTNPSGKVLNYQKPIGSLSACEAIAA